MGGRRGETKINMHIYLRDWEQDRSRVTVRGNKEHRIVKENKSASNYFRSFIGKHGNYSVFKNT
jgi:hypothetical protein